MKDQTQELKVGTKVICEDVDNYGHEIQGVVTGFSVETEVMDFGVIRRKEWVGVKYSDGRQKGLWPDQIVRVL